MIKNNKSVQLDKCRASIIFLEARVRFLENILFRKIPYLYRRSLLKELAETIEELRLVREESKKIRGKRNAKGK